MSSPRQLPCEPVFATKTNCQHKLRREPGGDGFTFSQCASEHPKWDFPPGLIFTHSINHGHRMMNDVLIHALQLT